jgi:hypothetical protein
MKPPNYPVELPIDFSDLGQRYSVSRDWDHWSRGYGLTRGHENVRQTSHSCWYDQQLNCKSRLLYASRHTIVVRVVFQITGWVHLKLSVLT